MAMGGDGDARGATQLKYNGTGATGANPLDMDVNIWYEVSLVFLPASHTPSASPFWSLFSRSFTACITVFSLLSLTLTREP